MKPEYLGHLLQKNIITDTDGRRYVHNRDVSRFMVSKERKQLDKEASHKRIMAMQNNNAVDSDYVDRKGRL